MGRVARAVVLWLACTAAWADYDIVGQSYLDDGELEYSAICGDGYAFTVRYDPGRETYRLLLGEVFATFDLAALRACQRAQRTVPTDYAAAGRPAE